MEISRGHPSLELRQPLPCVPSLRRCARRKLMSMFLKPVDLFLKSRHRDPLLVRCKEIPRMELAPSGAEERQRFRLADRMAWMQLACEALDQWFVIHLLTCGTRKYSQHSQSSLTKSKVRDVRPCNSMKLSQW